MDEVRSADVQYHIRHRHSDGEWVEMALDPSAHDPAEGDPERSWLRRLVFRCTHCDEIVTLLPDERSRS